VLKQVEDSDNWKKSDGSVNDGGVADSAYDDYTPTSDNVTEAGLESNVSTSRGKYPSSSFSFSSSTSSSSSSSSSYSSPYYVSPTVRMVFYVATV